jgi:uncharacterized membrane protein YoaK (UPF0700 family)
MNAFSFSDLDGVELLPLLLILFVNYYKEQSLITMAADDLEIFYYIPSKYVILGLSFIGGFVDASGYIKLYGLFTSSITGNLVVGCTDFFMHADGVFARLFVSATFALGAFVTTTLTLNLRNVLKQTPWDIGINLFGCEMAALAVSMLFGVCIDYSADEFPDLNSWQAIVTGSLLAFTMGVHNAAAQDLIANCPSTTVMTMTIVKTSIFASNSVQYWLASKGLVFMYPPKGEKPVDYELIMRSNYNAYSAKFYDNVKPLIFFVLGATVGAVLSIHMSFWCLFLPMLLLGILVQSIRASRSLHLRSEHFKLGNQDQVDLEEATMSPIVGEDGVAVAVEVSEKDSSI